MGKSHRYWLTCVDLKLLQHGSLQITENWDYIIMFPNTMIKSCGILTKCREIIEMQLVLLYIYIYIKSNLFLLKVMYNHKEMNNRVLRQTFCCGKGHWTHNYSSKCHILCYLTKFSQEIGQVSLKQILFPNHSLSSRNDRNHGKCKWHHRNKFHSSRAL